MIEVLISGNHRATIEGGEWKCPDSKLLERCLNTFEKDFRFTNMIGADPHPDLNSAKAAIKEFHGVIVRDTSLPDDDEPGLIY
jgi:hypothetical protein